MVERNVGNAVVRLVRGDITLAEADAFVHDITADCKLSSGYGGAIAARAGKVVQDELNAIGSCPTGEAVVTSGGNLKAQFIIHVNGPKFHEPDTAAKLRRATLAALCAANERGLERVALPPIGTGLYQVPLDLCARVMLQAVQEHLVGGSNVKEITFVANDSREFAPLETALATLAASTDATTPAAAAAGGAR